MTKSSCRSGRQANLLAGRGLGNFPCLAHAPFEIGQACEGDHAPATSRQQGADDAALIHARLDRLGLAVPEDQARDLAPGLPGRRARDDRVARGSGRHRPRPAAGRWLGHGHLHTPGRFQTARAPGMGSCPSLGRPGGSPGARSDTTTSSFAAVRVFITTECSPIPRMAAGRPTNCVSLSRTTSLTESRHFPFRVRSLRRALYSAALAPAG